MWRIISNFFVFPNLKIFCYKWFANKDSRIKHTPKDNPLSLCCYWFQCLTLVDYYDIKIIVVVEKEKRNVSFLIYIIWPSIFIEKRPTFVSLLCLIVSFLIDFRRGSLLVVKVKSLVGIFTERYEYICIPMYVCVSYNYSSVTCDRRHWTKIGSYKSTCRKSQLVVLINNAKNYLCIIK